MVGITNVDRSTVKFNDYVTIEFLHDTHVRDTIMNGYVDAISETLGPRKSRF